MEAIYDRYERRCTELGVTEGWGSRDSLLGGVRPVCTREWEVPE